MTLDPQQQQRLERLIDQACRALPPLQAPDSLAARVTAELERRAAQPAWRASFSHWPTALRVLFVLVALGLMAISLRFGSWSGAAGLATELLAPIAAKLGWLLHAGAWIAAFSALCSDLAATLLRIIPTLWLYGAIAALLTLYGTLAGISATAYRTLYGAR